MGQKDKLSSMQNGSSSQDLLNQVEDNILVEQKEVATPTFFEVRPKLGEGL